MREVQRGGRVFRDRYGAADRIFCDGIKLVALAFCPVVGCYHQTSTFWRKLIMQDKLLFAAGLVALLIGLFVGVKSDNVRKTAEENLVKINRQVDSVQQQLQMEEDRNKSIAVKLAEQQKELGVAENKLTIANNWYADLQEANSSLANDIYAIRLAMVEVLADLKTTPSVDGQKKVSEKLQKLVRMLDEHHAPGSVDQSASKEGAAAPESEAAGQATSNVETSEGKAAEAGEAAAGAAPGAETGAAESGQEEKAAPAAEEKNGGSGAPQTSAPAEEGKNAAPGSHGEESKKEGAVRL